MMNKSDHEDIIAVFKKIELCDLGKFRKILLDAIEDAQNKLNENNTFELSTILMIVDHYIVTKMRLPNYKYHTAVFL